MKYLYKSLFFKIYPPIFVDTFDTFDPYPLFLTASLSLFLWKTVAVKNM